MPLKKLHCHRLLRLSVWFVVTIFPMVILKPAYAVTLDAQVLDEDKSVVDTIATTLDYLREEISEEFFDLNYLDKQGLLDKTKNSPAFFFITDAATFASLMETGVWAVAAMKNPLAIDSSHTSGATFIARKERSDIASLMDLKGKTILGTSRETSLSTLIGLKELQRIFGENLSQLDLKYVGTPVERVVHEIISGDGDVGIVDSCLLERMEKDGNISSGLLKVISPRDSKDLICKHSTELYPGWILAVSKSSNLLNEKEQELILKVTAALQNVPKLPGLLEWSNPANDSAIRTLLDDVRHKKVGKEFWQLIWYKYFYWLLFFAAFIVLVVSHSLYASWLVRKKTNQLTLSMKKTEELQQKIHEEQEKISSMERASIASQLSGLIAHELQQPLNAITNFSRGLRIREERGILDDTTLRETLIKITQQSEDAVKIVGKVRNYAKQRAADHQSIEIVSQLGLSIEKFEQIKGREVSIELLNKNEEPCLVEGDLLELDLVFYNLLKNAWEACKNQSNPKISISVELSSRKVFVLFKDNGPKVTQQLVDSMFVPGISSKTEGLGLGLSICRGLVEAHGGNIKASLSQDGHVCVELELPRLVKKARV